MDLVIHYANMKENFFPKHEEFIDVLEELLRGCENNSLTQQNKTELGQERQGKKAY